MCKIQSNLQSWEVALTTVHQIEICIHVFFFADDFKETTIKWQTHTRHPFLRYKIFNWCIYLFMVFGFIFLFLFYGIYIMFFLSFFVFIYRSKFVKNKIQQKKSWFELENSDFTCMDVLIITDECIHSKQNS